MKIAIIEDEKIAIERLDLLLKKYDPEIEIAARLYSVEEAVSWLKNNQHPDLLLVDINLSDGLSFSIFDQVEISRPVIFTTAYDQYALDAFKYYCIDYLVKPVSFESLSRALQKMKDMNGLNKSDMLAISQALGQLQQKERAYKERFLAKVGKRMFFINATDVEYFQADNKIVYLVDKSGNRLQIDYTLDNLEKMMDPHDFFRLNRTYLVRFGCIEQAKPYINNRLKVMLKTGAKSEEVIISRERVPEFRTWAEGV
jgi:DNA-binding LytR/AlgR family response regulator